MTLLETLEYFLTGTAIVLPQKDFDALVDRLNEPPKYDEKIAKLLQRKAPWDDEE